ncbi:MAG TPA: putative monovalent cation/H+ antiporter subunit A, partial [Salinibacter sp.]|nr:putative monovalent cation/H+ antiporter subunit A [Salinibacter sp.]
LAAPLLVRGVGRAAGWVLAFGPVALFAWFAAYAPPIRDGATFRETTAWVPSLDVEASFMLDGLSLLFVILITGLGAVITVYAGRYLEGHRDLGRFFLTFLAFMSAMLGVVLADNLLLLFIFWEATSLCSYLLVGFKHEKENARTSALQALLVTGTGGLALLVGILLLGVAGGSFELSVLVERATQVQSHPLYLPAFILIAIGAFTKSAQVPFHFWLPNAMAAPTPVSAYLHSATMVKAGIYLLARMDPILGGTGVWIWTLAAVGSATMLVGAVGALRHTDLKKVLAYSTITALGTLVVLLGLSYGPSIKAAIVFLLVHALYKSGLFLVAGSIDHGTGTRDVTSLGGLRRAMPLTALAAVLAGLSMAGLPPLFGFVGKELTYKAKLGVENLEWLLPAIAVFANALTVAAAAILVAKPFFGRLQLPKTTSAHEVPFAMWSGPLLIGTVGLLFGAVPGMLYYLVTAAVNAVAGEVVEIKLALWYGFNTALYLSVATVGLGLLAYRFWTPIRRALTRAERMAILGPARAYQALLDGLFRLAAWQTRFWQDGSVRTSLAATFGVVVLLVGGTLGLKSGLVPTLGPVDVWPYEGALVILVGAAAIVAAGSTSRLLALTGLGVVGLGIALVFVLMGAPDLAMTQFLVEILIVVIALAVLQALPSRDPGPSRRGRGWALPIAGGVGATVSLLLLATLRLPLDRTIPDYFLTESVPGGFGRNVVNVILVDFRALDTLGEIAVLAVAALGAFALLRLGPDVPSVSVRPTLPSVVLRTGAQLLLALLLLTSLFMLWRGHNEPGGGFIGGLFAASAVVLYLLAFGRTATDRLLRVPPRLWLGVGLAVAVASGLVGTLLAGPPFLTGQWTTLGGLKLGTPLLFDIGVFLVVVGFTLTIVLALERIVGTRENPPPPDPESAPSTDRPQAVGHDHPAALDPAD